MIGPNGSGKSTLLTAIAGLLDYTGEVELEGTCLKQVSIAEMADHRAFLSQSDRPAFNIEVAHYLALSIPKHALNAQQEIEDAISQLTAILQVNDKLHRSVHQLSGGEWQRVRLCAICLQVWPTLNPFAKLLILDEPAAPLDIGQEAMLYQLIDMIAAKGLCVIMSNHDLNRTLKHADHAILLDKGVMQAVGKVDEVLTPSKLTKVFNTHVERVSVNGKEILLFD
ncbi:vitamin B12 ABC transporter ATPase component BtuD [Vibrio ponticus]|nr:vitamin B12 ABC transporter ATPase component BtuD [Vibrio ponticus]